MSNYHKSSSEKYSSVILKIFSALDSWRYQPLEIFNRNRNNTEDHQTDMNKNIIIIKKLRNPTRLQKKIVVMIQ